MKELEMGHFVVFGEILLRLKSIGYQRLLQDNHLESTFGGAELNVAVCLSRLGETTSMITALPTNDIGRACLDEIRRHGVNIDHIVQNDSARMGLYFLESGSNLRPARVTYDRAGSAITQVTEEDFDWSDIFSQGGYFHLSGITPALSKSAAETALYAVDQAHRHSLKISFDFNFRKQLWKDNDLEPKGYFQTIVTQTNILFASTGDCQDHLEIDLDLTGLDSVAAYENCSARMFDKYPDLEIMTSTFRDVVSSDHQTLYACMRSRSGFFVSKTITLRDIVDRIGTGDAYAAGILYGLKNFPDAMQKTVDFGLASACLKHTIPGDFNLITLDEIEDLVQSGGDVAVRR